MPFQKNGLFLFWLGRNLNKQLRIERLEEFTWPCPQLKYIQRCVSKHIKNTTRFKRRSLELHFNGKSNLKYSVRVFNMRSCFPLQWPVSATLTKSLKGKAKSLFFLFHQRNCLEAKISCGAETTFYRGPCSLLNVPRSFPALFCSFI